MIEEIKSKEESENPSNQVDKQSNDHINANLRTNVSPQNAMDQPCECASKEGSVPNSNEGGSMAENTSYIYVTGRITPRFPNIELEKELLQATGRTDTAGLTDREALQSVLSQRQNRYLARQICWVLTVEGIETYILTMRDPADLDLLIESLRPSPRPTDIDVVIGIKGPIATPEMCNGLTVPIVVVTQVYSFDIDTLIKSIPRPQGVPAKQFGSTAEEIYSRIAQMADNAGATDEHRALNYLAVRYHTIYTQSTEMFSRDFSLTAIEVRPSRLSGVRKIEDVIFSYTNRNTDVTEKYFVRVDVTGEFPFLVTKLLPYYER
jgi:PatG C-terminal